MADCLSYIQFSGRLLLSLSRISVLDLHLYAGICFVDLCIGLLAEGKCVDILFPYPSLVCSAAVLAFVSSSLWRYMVILLLAEVIRA